MECIKIAIAFVLCQTGSIEKAKAFFNIFETDDTWNCDTFLCYTRGQRVLHRVPHGQSEPLFGDPHFQPADRVDQQLVGKSRDENNSHHKVP